MQLAKKHIKALDEAERLMFHCDFCPYLDLKDLLSDKSRPGRKRFRTLFTNYYRLNVGGLTDSFKDEYFKLLFGTRIVASKPYFDRILRQLYKIKRKKGDHALSLSFASKLVAMHQENSPIYDKHVLAFFGKKPLPAAERWDARIEWYIQFLNDVEGSYIKWADDNRVKPIVARLVKRDQRLKDCHKVRLMDFLVWKAGSQKLLQSKLK